MYTEDDKNSKRKHNQYKSGNNEDRNYDVNFYKEFSKYDADNYNDFKYDGEDHSYQKKSKGNVNKLDTSYSDDYSDDTYKYNKNYLDNKKYTVIIIILFILLIVLICVLVRSINVKNPPVGNNSNYVRLQYNQLEMQVGETKKIELILSDMKSDYKIEWFSNNDSVVTVDDNGNIRAINKGEAIILVAYYLNDKVYDAQCYITVSK